MADSVVDVTDVTVNVDKINIGEESIDKQYDLTGPNSTYIKLVSSDDREFIVEREHAYVAKTIKKMLSGPGEFKEHETNIINFREIPGDVLQKVCEYFEFKHKYKDTPHDAVPDFEVSPTNIVIEVLMAAHFLDC